MAEGETEVLQELQSHIELAKAAKLNCRFCCEAHDRNNAILNIHWRRRHRVAIGRLCCYACAPGGQKRGYKVQILDYVGADEAGLKNVTLLVSGPLAYGYLRAEKGVHRLVRISPFDASGRRHTSFASVEVMPEIDNDEEVEIRQEDLRIDTYRAGGAGGQHVNKTSAVRLPCADGVVVQCKMKLPT